MTSSPPPDSAKNSSKNKPRLGRAGLFVLVHRYVGLVMSVFLIVAGLTGSLIAFYWPVDLLVNPELLEAKVPHPGASELSPLEIQKRLNEQLPDKDHINGLVLYREDGINYNYWLDGKEVFVNPYTGQLVGMRTFGDITEGRRNVIGFLYQMHYTLALGDVGVWIMGLVGLLWTIDCFVGAYLTFPPPARNAKRERAPSWLSRWAPAWLLKTTKVFSLVFTWHRASGLWVWAFLLVFAWSSVALNLHDEVYAPTMNLVFGKGKDVHDQLPHLDPPREKPALSVFEAYERSRALMDQQAKAKGFQVLSERYVWYEAEHGTYAYNVESSRDVSQRLAETTLHIDGDTGKQVAFELPDDSHTGTMITRWIVALHFGAVRIGGMPYRIFVCALGFVVVLLSVTGIWIWWRKRQKRVGRALPSGAA